MDEMSLDDYLASDFPYEAISRHMMDLCLKAMEESLLQYVMTLRSKIIDLTKNDKDGIPLEDQDYEKMVVATVSYLCNTLENPDMRRDILVGIFRDVMHDEMRQDMSEEEIAEARDKIVRHIRKTDQN